MESYLSDEDIEYSYTGYSIRELKMNSSGSSGFIDIEFPFNEDKCDNFIIYDSGIIAFDYWYPDKIYKELCEYINTHK